MHIRARIRRVSSVHALWTAHLRRGGVVAGVQFVRQGNDFLATEDPLSPASFDALRHHPDIEFELSGIQPPAKATVEPTEEPKTLHPSELPQHLKEAVAEAKMDPEHEPLNELLEEPSEPAPRKRGRPPKSTK